MPMTATESFVCATTLRLAGSASSHSGIDVTTVPGWGAALPCRAGESACRGGAYP
jgi:hypothetical protein